MQNIKDKNTHQHVNIKFLSILLTTSLIFNSCSKEEIQEVPSYITISEFSLTTNLNEGSNTENITDVWIYANDQFRGAFELPATIPLLHEGSTNLKIFAGIKDNGISGTRVRYHFYKSYEEDVNLVKDSITLIKPNFQYTENANFEIENFEGVGTNIDTTLNSEVDFDILTENGNKYGSALLEGNYLKFEIATDDFEDLPQGGSPVYMEIDYKTNQILLVGAYINYPQTIVNSELLWITPKEEWHKIYINMTQTVSQAIGNNSIKFYVNMFRTDTTEDSWVKFDNIKIIY